MNEILQSIDESVFTTALKLQMQEAFDAKIEQIKKDLGVEYEKYSILIQEAHENKFKKLEESSIEYGKYAKAEYAELERQVEEYSDYAVNQFETAVKKHEKLAEKYSEYVKEQYAEIVEAFLDKVVEEYIEENRLVIDSSVSESKVKALLEGISSVMLNSGVELSQIVESSKEVSNPHKTEELENKIALLIKENAKLKKINDSIIKSNIVQNLSEGLTLAQKEKFSKLANVISFVNESSFHDKLETLKSDLIVDSNSNSTNVALEESKANINGLSIVQAMYQKFI